MRTASDYQTPAVPYHTLICRSFSTPNTALVRKNAEYITNTEKGAYGAGLPGWVYAIGDKLIKSRSVALANGYWEPIIL